MISGRCFPILDLEQQLYRMYNLGMHTSLPQADVPFAWVLKWSRLLEEDLTEQRLRNMVAATGGRKKR